MSNSPPHKKLKLLSTPTAGGTKSQLFTNLNVCVLEQGLGKTRCNIFVEQLKKHGACATRSLQLDTQYLLVGKGMKLERMLKLLKCKKLPETIMVLNVDWLSASLVSGKQEEFETYKMFTKYSKEDTTEVESPPKMLSVPQEVPACSSTKAKTSYDELIELKTNVNYRDDNDTSSDEGEPEQKMEIVEKKANLPVSILCYKEIKF